MMIIEVDGACSGNPGIGGWAIRVLRNAAFVYSSYGSKEDTTNNRMEVTAIIRALKAAIMLQQRKEVIEIRTDSNWAYKCIRGDWNCTLNIDLLDRVNKLMEGLDVRLKKVGRDELKYVDNLARKAIKIGKKKYERQNKTSTTN